MRARHICLLAFFAFALSCSNISGKLEDVDWGNSFKADYAETVARAKKATLRYFPKGFDPDKTNEEAGDFWTIWHYDKSVWYRGTTRYKGHVKVDHAGEGKVRVGVAVVTQINDNIDNPHDTGKDARWVKTQRDIEKANLIERAVARRYLDATPSERWTYEHDPDKDKKKGMRDDLTKRGADIDLEDPETQKEIEEATRLKRDG